MSRGKRSRAHHLLRDHHLRGLPRLRAHARRLHAPRGGPRRQARCHQRGRGSAAHHRDPGLDRPSAVSGRDPARDRGREGGHPQAPRALRGGPAAGHGARGHRGARGPSRRAPPRPRPAVAGLGRARPDGIPGRGGPSRSAAPGPARAAPDPECRRGPDGAAPSRRARGRLRGGPHPRRLARPDAAPAPRTASPGARRGSSSGSTAATTPRAALQWRPRCRGWRRGPPISSAGC